MENAEQYFLQVLRRTQMGLQDSLIPFHAEKCTRMIEKIDMAASVRGELENLKKVTGFYRAALSMEWIIERTTATDEDFSPERFESDVMMLNDKLFEAFLGEPFDGGEELFQEQNSQSNQAGAASVFASDDVSAAMLKLDEPVKEMRSIEDYFEPFREIEPDEPRTIGLAELLEQNLLLAFQRFVETVSGISAKTGNDRISAFALLKMIAKSCVDVARVQKKMEVYDYFQAMLEFIKYLDTYALHDDPKVTEVSEQISLRLSKALTETTDGARYLAEITALVRNPSSLFV